MAQNFINKTRDHLFIVKEWLDSEKIMGFDRFKDVYSVDDADAILTEALRMSEEVIAPTNDENDEIGVQFENGKVTVPPGMKEAYWFIQENGWGSCNVDPNYEYALPRILMGAVGEYMAGANMGLTTYYLATSGAAELIEEFGSDHLKELFLEKMYSGEWAGTMDLTEPNGGSDVGDLLTKAFPTDKPGVYKIKGSKCFISGGEQDITENIIHLTLARVEGARPGTSGISLFVIPKYWVNDDGSLGEFNDINCVSIEHKMGIRGNATCTLAFGENNECRGWILGDPPGEDGRASGMRQMFNMMNEERLNTGMGALSVATVAYYNSAEYARERIQGRPITNPKGDRVPIIKHEDVRRMLLDQKAHLEAMRAMAFKTLYYLDVAENSPDPEEREIARARAEVNTPLIKAYNSDMGWILCAEAMQVYGGYGYSEEYPIAQLCRDIKILSIWEGTNYIQSMDLVGRKWMLKKGALFQAWLDEITSFIDKNGTGGDFDSEMALLKEAINAYNQIRLAIRDYAMGGKIQFMPLFATRILHATAKLYCSYVILDQALVAQNKIKELGEDHYDYPFYRGKVEAARYYVNNVLPDVMTLAEVIKKGDASVLDIPEDAFFV